MCDKLNISSLFIFSPHGKYNLALRQECVYHKRNSAPAGKSEDSAMSVPQRFDRFLRKLAAVKSSREHPSIQKNQPVIHAGFYLHILKAPPAQPKGLEPQKVNITDFMLSSVWVGFWRNF